MHYLLTIKNLKKNVKGDDTLHCRHVASYSNTGGMADHGVGFTKFMISRRQAQALFYTGG